ncbi:MAG: hypothetical protein CVU23_07345 [Betaproteobacteria bacterium HGW-Betaproteobacteria-17]|nr:MAG: hypothetical protein CVU23_07345 [Betaproteobacteria bacterium HGW-Betaproteobacteria-17]
MIQQVEKATIFDKPAYPASEAAYILNLPPATVKAWSFGQTRRDDGGVRFKAVIRAADTRNKLLSFANLCELHVLAAIRRVHRVSLPKVRDSVEYLRSQLGADRPLIDRQFKTNGIDLFVEQASKLLNVSRQGQEALRGEFELALARIERDNQGNPIKLFPYSRTSDHTAEQPKSVVIDPRLSFGRPVLTRSAVPTEVIFDRFQAGDSLEDMALDYNVDEKEIEEALRFEQRRAA